MIELSENADKDVWIAGAKVYIAELEARIRKLTEWRPMDAAPDDWVVGRCLREIEIVKRFPSGRFYDRELRIRNVYGWLPLPEVAP